MNITTMVIVRIVDGDGNELSEAQGPAHQVIMPRRNEFIEMPIAGVRKLFRVEAINHGFDEGIRNIHTIVVREVKQ